MVGGGGAGQSRGELETAKVLNTVATIGAIHPTYHAVRDLYRHKTPESRARIERTLARPIPKKVKAGAASLKARASNLRIPKGSGKKAAVATTGAWLGLHSAELVGDVMARRSINSQIAQVKGPPVKKSLSTEQSLMSNSDYARRGTGVGLNLEKAWKGEPGDKRNTKYYLSFGAGALTAGGIAGAIPANRRIVRVGNKWGMRAAKNAYSRSDPDRGFTTLRAGLKAQYSTPGFKRMVATRAGASIAGGALGTTGYASYRRTKRKAAATPGFNAVEKRHFNAESDRQRRIGAASGVLAGTSIVTGAAAMKGLQFRRGITNEAGRRMAGASLGYLIPKDANPKKLLRNRAALAAAALATGGGAVASYKRGISQRNQTWM